MDSHYVLIKHVLTCTSLILKINKTILPLHMTKASKYAIPIVVITLLITPNL